MCIERFNNVIFPLFIVIFLPPFIIIPLISNLIIDGSVYYLFLRQTGWMPPRKQLGIVILVAWILGFIADLLGVAILIAAAELLPLNINITQVWSDLPTIITFLLTISLVGLIIYLLNRLLLLKVLHTPRSTANLVALAMGIITAPWFFLIPVTWFKSFM